MMVSLCHLHWSAKLFFSFSVVSARFFMGTDAWTFSEEIGQVNNVKKNNHLGNLIMPHFCVSVV